MHAGRGWEVVGGFAYFARDAGCRLLTMLVAYRWSRWR